MAQSSLKDHSRELRRQWFQHFQRQVADDGTTKLIIPYEIEKTHGFDEGTIQQAMETIQEHSCVRFVARKSEQCYLIITKGKGCYYLGDHVPPCLPTISLGYGCEGYGIVLHELLHALSFQHKQQRPDRDEHVKIIWDNIKTGIRSQFEKIKPEDYRWNDFHFDYESIMMYESYAFSKYPSLRSTITKKDGGLITRNDKLSHSDEEKLKALAEIVDENNISDEQESTDQQTATEQRTDGEKKGCKII